MNSERIQPRLFPAPEPRTKTSFSLTAETKFRLATIKRDMRRDGAAATESSIVEALVALAVDDVSVKASLEMTHAAIDAKRRAI